ncbi:hypothetical protein [Natrialbaceae archaeon AArc-T1-2]|uniref:hypothetical protein n=1 Tax=Natrialbaceae archaeon AArc-T1-2 TaxID=3053904 RepID=UPI00255B3CB8|nr:hypothetical protein [Natrialbaceae archaeon AArc-T1-2]WIV68862.1 hypothetical protein QQ977_16305 [Natrialbaceae archaeon AArc-T1-2]
MQPRYIRIALVAVIVFAAVAFAATSPALSGSDYDIDADDSIDTPERTVEIEGDEFDVSAIGAIEPGEEIDISVTSTQDYRIYLYNTDSQDEFSENFDADESHVTIGTADDELDTSNLDAGTYMLTLNARDDGRQAVQPLVIQGYDLSLDHPESGTTDEAIELTATAEPETVSDQPDTVEVAIWDGDNDVTDVTLDHTGDTSYEATLDLGNLDEGDYEVYAAVPADEEAQGYPTALAVDTGEALTVTEASDDGESDDGAGGGGGDDDTGTDDQQTDDSGDGADDEGTDDTDDVDDGMTDEQDDEAGNGEGDDADSADNGDESDADDTDGGADDTDDEVIEPGDDDDRDDDEPSDGDQDTLGIPGLSLLVVVVSFALSGYLLAHRD